MSALNIPKKKCLNNGNSALSYSHVQLSARGLAASFFNCMWIDHLYLLDVFNQATSFFRWKSALVALISCSLQVTLLLPPFLCIPNADSDSQTFQHWIFKNLYTAYSRFPMKENKCVILSITFGKMQHLFYFQFCHCNVQCWVYDVQEQKVNCYLATRWCPVNGYIKDSSSPLWIPHASNQIRHYLMAMIIKYMRTAYFLLQAIRKEC